MTDSHSGQVVSSGLGKDLISRGKMGTRDGRLLDLDGLVEDPG